MNSMLGSQLAPFVNRYRTKTSSGAFDGTSKLDVPGSKKEPNAFTRSVLQQLHRDLAAWEASSRGKAALAQLPHLGLGGRIKILKEIVAGAALERTVSLIRTQPDRTAEQGINAVSIAFEFQVAVLWQGSLSVGVAFDPYDPLGRLVVFVCLGLAVGELGLSFGTQGGVWTCAPADVGGLSLGGQATLLVNGLGFSVDVSISPTGVGFLLTLGLGVEVGLSPAGWYTFILYDSAYDPPPFYQDDASHFLILTKLECKNISGGDGDHNEVYFTFTANNVYYHRFPQWNYFSMAEGDTWSCGRSVKLQDWIDVDLYDVDDTSGDDLLGRVRIDRSQLTVGAETSFELRSKNGLDERQYYIYAKLIY